MQQLVAGVLRPRLLTSILAGALAGCAPAPFERDPTAEAALAYLETTEDELGVDVLAAAQVYGDLTGDPRGREVVSLRLPDVRPSQLERYGAFLELDKHRLPERTLEGVPAPGGVPDPSFTLDDDRDARCPEEMLTCTVGEGCVEYALLDGWGYVLTHQSLWLLVARWRGCTLPPEIDVDERRATYGARLVAETRADPEPGDLFYERLAMLGHLGHGGEIESAWIDALRASQSDEGCFPVDAIVRCHPHPTGLALWALAHDLARER